MPKVSVIMPIYGVEKFVKAAVNSVLDQTFTDFELLVIDDVSPDRSTEIVRAIGDNRIRIIVHQENRGLAGARNTGIRNATGKYLAFLDSDDVWQPHKLEKHVAHLDSDPSIGISFSRSAFIDQDGNSLDTYQMPKLDNIDTPHLMCRNPVGNGSAPVIRRETLDDIAFKSDIHQSEELYYFDESFRQSEDIECWIRISATTEWKIRGLNEALTLYRLNAGGLSANIPKQLATWESVIAKTATYAPKLVEEHGGLAKAYQLRYLSRQAIRLKDGDMAMSLFLKAMRCDWRILLLEPGKTLVTGAAATIQKLLPVSFYQLLEPVGVKLIGTTQKLRIKKTGLFGHGPRQAH